MAREHSLVQDLMRTDLFTLLQIMPTRGELNRMTAEDLEALETAATAAQEAHRMARAILERIRYPQGQG